MLPWGWIDYAWPMMAAACVTLALVHGGIWFRLRAERAALWFACAALSIVGVAAIELGEMRALTPERYIAIHSWIVLPLFGAGVSLALFARSFFQAGRNWLLWVTIASRAAVLVVNFFLPHGINWADVPAIRQVALPGGERATVALGTHTHWTHLDEFAWTMQIIYTLDATLTAMRRSRGTARRQFARVGGAMLAVFAIGVPLSALVHARIVESPYFVTPIFLSLLATMGYELSGRVVRAAVLAEDLQKSEARWRATERDLELAAEAAGLGIGTLDLTTGELAATDRVRQHYGFAKDEPIRLDELLERTHPHDRQRIRDAIAAAVETREPFEEEYRVRRPQGGWLWLSARARVRENEDGPGLRMRGVTFEITARRQAEEHFRLVFEAAQSALLIVERDGRIVAANSRAESYFGYRRDQLIGGSVDRLVPDSLREAHAKHRQAYVREPQTRSMGAGLELVGRRMDGTDFPVEVGLSPLSGQSGEFILASIVDITERRRLELAAARQRSELAHLSRVAVLGELSASIAHDLNQPLGAILSNAQAAQRLLERDTVDLPQLREILSDVVESDRRAGEVIRRLRAMLRKEELPHLPLDLYEVVSDVLQIMNSDFINRGVTVEANLAERLPKISGDRVQLQQVLLNLFINACEAMAAQPRPRHLEIRTSRVGEMVELVVADSGPGIAPQDLERVFEPFVTTKAQGTGLGLAVCRTIVQAHGGSIRATAGSLGGANFVVSLPLAV